MSEATYGLTRAAGTGYQSGFGDEFATEALPGVLPVGRSSGCAIHLYAATASMRDRFFYLADGELPIVPASESA